MKKFLSIALSLMLALGILSSLGIIASASDANDRIFPEVHDLGRIPTDLGDLGIDYYAIWNAFPEELELNYENGIYYANDDGYTKVEFWSYLNYQTYELTLVDGKWQCELPADVNERGGLVYVYDGDWMVNYRGGTKEAVFLEGENEGGSPYKLEVMSHLIRIWTARYIGDNTFTGDAYYTKEGDLDYVYVTGFFNGNQIVVYYNAEREATMVYDGRSYMFPDGNWYADDSTDSELCEPLEIFAEMSFEDFVELIPCVIYCGDHQLTEYNCELGQYCTKCFEMTKAQSYHDFADATCKAPATCKNCGATEGDPLEHGYDAEDFVPDCEHSGYTLYTCRDCGYSYVADEIPAFGHTYDATVTEPTCEEGGYTEYVCCDCGDAYVDDEVDALGHDWIDEDGIICCSVCGEAQQDETTETTAETIESQETETVEVTEKETERETEKETVIAPIVPEETESEELSEEVAAPVESETEEKSETVEVTETQTDAEEESTTKAKTTEEKDGEKKSGCGSSISMGAVSVIVTVCATGIIFKRKKND